MKRFPLALMAFLGLAWPALGNPLDTLTRTEKGAPLTQSDNDNNLGLIETAVHNLQPITLQTAPCTIPMGCTGAATLPSGILKGAGTGPIVAATPGTDFQIPIVSTGVLKGTGSAVGSAVAGTDFQAPINVSGVLRGSGGGNVGTATAGTDYQAPITATGVLKGSGSSVVQATAGSDYQAPVSATGILKSNGTSGNVGAAAAGTDYQAPSADLTCLSGAVTSGIHARTGSGTCAERTITAGTGISVANGNGVSADPVVSMVVPVTTLSIASDQAFTSTTVADATGFLFAEPINHTFQYNCVLILTTSSTTLGPTIAIQRPSGTNDFIFEYQSSASNTVGPDAFTQCFTAGATSSGSAGCVFTTSPTSGVAQPFFIRGMSRASTAGNWQLQVGVSAGGTTTLKAGSSCKVTDMG
jgi:hypothetical protein